MKNLSNLLAVFVLVAMMGLLAGCGCGATETPAEEDMVNNTTQEALPPADTTPEDTPMDNTMEDSTVSDNMTVPGENDGTVVDENGNVVDDAVGTDGNALDDAGNMVGDVVEDAGDAVSDVGEGVKRMTDDATGSNR